MGNPRVSERFCALDADLNISSSDGVVFKVHRKNLEVHSDIFADAGNTTLPETGGQDDVIELSESAAVLDLLFQYMYRQLQPDLNDSEVKFELFAGLAEAAEKYMVYSALTLCRMKMKDSISEHPLQTLDYALRHSHVDMANESAPHSMRYGVTEAFNLLSPDSFRKWIAFYDEWNKDVASLLACFVSWPAETGGIGCARKILSSRNGCYTSRQEVLAEIRRQWREYGGDVRTKQAMPLYEKIMGMKIVPEVVKA